MLSLMMSAAFSDLEEEEEEKPVRVESTDETVNRLQDERKCQLSDIFFGASLARTYSELLAYHLLEMKVLQPFHIL